MKTIKYLSVCLTALLVGLMSMNVTPIGAQTGKHDLTKHTWTDGLVEFTVRRGSGGVLIFEGQTLDGDSYSFELKPEGGDFYRLQEDNLPLINRESNMVRLRPYGNKMYLVVYDAKSMPIYVLAPDQDLRKTIEADLTNLYLAGEYTDKNGRTITFYPSPITDPQNRMVKGLTADGKAVRYTFGEAHHTPTNVIILPDGSTYLVEKTDDRLTVRKTTMKEDEWAKNGEAIIHNAQRTRYLSERDGLVPGDFPFTAYQALTMGQLTRVENADLRVMLNEIYARRGQRFKSLDTRLHFESKDWYHPEADDVSDRLTELDSLNIAMIRQTLQLMTFRSFALDGYNYSVSVGGIQYGDPIFGQHLGGGTAIYDPDSMILTLRNATIRGEGIALHAPFQQDIPSSGYPFTIRLEGENTIETDSDTEVGIEALFMDLTITGGGSLTYRTKAAEQQNTIWARNLSIQDGCRLDMTGEIQAMLGVEFNDVDVHITDGGVSTQYFGILLFNCAITLPEGERPICKKQSDEGNEATICLPDGSPAKEIRIERRKSAGNAPE